MSEQIIGDHSMEELVNEGIFEFSGLNENEEPMFTLNTEVAKTKAPDIYQAYEDDAMMRLLKAVDEGYVEWNAIIHSGTGEIETFVEFTEKCDELTV